MAEGLDEVTVISLSERKKIYSVYEINKNISPWTEAGPVSFDGAELTWRLAS